MDKHKQGYFVKGDMMNAKEFKSIFVHYDLIDANFLEKVILA